MSKPSQAIIPTEPKDLLKDYRLFLKKYDSLLQEFCLHTRKNRLNHETFKSYQKRFDTLWKKWELPLINDVMSCLNHVEALAGSATLTTDDGIDQPNPFFDEVIFKVSQLRQATSLQVFAGNAKDFSQSWLHATPAELNDIIEKINEVYETKYELLTLGNEQQAPEVGVESRIGNMQVPICPNCKTEGRKLDLNPDGTITCGECKGTFDFGGNAVDLIKEMAKDMEDLQKEESPIKIVPKSNVEDVIETPGPVCHTEGCDRPGSFGFDDDPNFYCEDCLAVEKMKREKPSSD